ncbi:MAG TPA: MMPL family transporter [Gallionella sp.]|nr:MMPL family transporter [Gallionella sp.]
MKRRAVALWLAFLALAILVASRVQIGADLSAFLPQSPTPAQELLTEQLRNGVVSRLILLGIEDGTPEAQALTSKRLAQQLRNDRSFAMVNNGEESALAKDSTFLLENRYLLSPAVTPEHFAANALHDALENSLQLLGSPAGVLLKRLIPRDPSGEMLALLDETAGENRPATQDGVWMSRDSKRALLLVQTSAPGFDIDAQEQAVARIRKHFAAATGSPELSGQRLLLSGPGVFAVEARNNIKNVALYFSLFTALLVSLLLWLVYRSGRVLALSLLPVASGALAGVAAVSLGYGVVYGVTLGFGITLIGEAVDYAIYFFTRLGRENSPDTALDTIWPTLRLGVLTTVCGFSPMFLAGFPGLAQLGLFSVTGIIVAVLVTRWVLPVLTPANFSTMPPALLSGWLMRLIGQASRLRLLVLVAMVAAIISMALHRGPLWSDTLSSLSPVPATDLQLDEALRRDLGAPDVRYLVIVRGQNRETALEHAEAVGAQLDRLIRNNPSDSASPLPCRERARERVEVQQLDCAPSSLFSRDTNQPPLTGYDTPARYLPSEKTQRARLAALPDAKTLRANLQQALAGLPFRDDLFEPFISDVAATRNRPPLTQADLRGTSLGLQVESLLVQRDSGWTALLPLRGVTDAGLIRQTLAQPADTGVVLLDLKQESDTLYQSYVREAVLLAAGGALAIVLLLFISLRSPRRVVLVLAPLAAAVIVTTAVVLASGQQLLLFHLVGLLLAVAVGSNYSLFFEREAFRRDHFVTCPGRAAFYREDDSSVRAECLAQPGISKHEGRDDARERTMVSLLVANLATIIGFGMLTFSGVPILTAIGSTVALGAFLSLLFSAVMMGNKVAA